METRFSTTKRQMNNEIRNPGFGETGIRRHIICDWESYEVKKEELTLLEKFNYVDYFFDISIFCLSGGISFLVSWFTINEETQPRTSVTFLVIYIVLFVLAFLFFTLSIQGKKERYEILENIKNRPISEEV